MNDALPVSVIRGWRLLVGLLLLYTCVTHASLAQPLRGAIRDSSSQVLIAGAIVTLLDDGGATLARTLSSERGLYFFATRGNASSLRVQRIGYRARTLSLPNAVGDITTLNVMMAKLPTLLAPMRVVDKGCPRRADEGSAVSLLEQARTGLLATVVARREFPSSQVLIQFEREMSGTSQRIVSQKVHIDTAAVRANTFESAHSATDFVARGFTESAENETVFHAPDADVLLDDDFVAAYCFHLAKPDRSRVNQVGLAFHAVRSARNRVDVEGALWIDTVARAIREIEFQYRGLPPEIERLNPGGTINFREMTSGVVLIDRWTLRLVGTEADTVVAARGLQTIRDRFRVTETGGELARATWPDGSTWNAQLGALVVDASTQAQLPAMGTQLRLTSTNYGGITDSVGRLRISNLIPGPYRLVVVDPRLSTIGVDIDTPINIVARRDSTYAAALRVKSAEEYVGERCGNGKRSTDSLAGAWIAGRVVADSSTSVDALQVTVTREKTPHNWQPIKDYFDTGSDGLFYICSDQLRPAMPVRIEIRRRGKLLQTLEGALDGFLTILNVPVKFE